MSFLELIDVRKSFGAGHAVHQFNLSVRKGEFISFLGPSGCGKTTTLRMIAGFETPSSGSVMIDGRDVTSLPPNQRKIGMVFQSYALFPNMSVAENIAFGLKVAKMPAAERSARIDEMLALIGLEKLKDRYPYQLSGGQQQRVALARAIAPKPQILLLDEPLSALDAKIRVSLREEIRAIQRELGITTIFVTHDQEEALSMSDRVVLMNEGRVEQIGTPFEIYHRPSSKFAASFVGTINFIDAQVVDGASGRISIEGQDVIVNSLPPELQASQACTIAIRPQALSINGTGIHDVRLNGLVEDINFLGSVTRIKVRLDRNAILLDTFNTISERPLERGQPITVNVARDDLIVVREQ